MRLALSLLACGALGLWLGACESTEQESEKIGRQSTRALAGTSTLHLGPANRDVRVSDVTLLSGAGRRAVALRLTGTGTSPQVEVPVLVSVTGAGGRQLYTNTTVGLESSLQHMPLLRAGVGQWWVDDQVLTSLAPSTVHVHIGAGAGRVQGALPDMSASVVEVGEAGGSTVLTGNLVNRSALAQSKVPVFAVAVRGGKVTAAGRALVPSVGPGSTAKPASAQFQIFLVGSPAGSSYQLTVAPTTA